MAINITMHIMPHNMICLFVAFISSTQVQEITGLSRYRIPGRCSC
uniref:Uncharacterized protein n=1 Tax=Rhizophora mucronata TaxID=61149 RepID=A0A2P2QSB7_RHIMU